MWTTAFVFLMCLAIANSSPSPQSDDIDDYLDNYPSSDDRSDSNEEEYEYPDYEYGDDYNYEDYYDYPSRTSDDPELIVKDAFTNKKCSDFKIDGFECVPFYACFAGEIITNGATLINIRNVGRRRKKRSVALGPLDAKCFCKNEICCRLPDYNSVNVTVDVVALANITGNEPCEQPRTPEPDTPPKSDPIPTPTPPTSEATASSTSKIPKDPATKIQTTLDAPYEFVWQGSQLSHGFWDVGEVVQTSVYDEENIIQNIKINFWENYGQNWHGWR